MSKLNKDYTVSIERIAKFRYHGVPILEETVISAPSPKEAVLKALKMLDSKGFSYEINAYGTHPSSEMAVAKTKLISSKALSIKHFSLKPILKKTK